MGETPKSPRPSSDFRWRAEQLYERAQTGRTLMLWLGETFEQHDDMWVYSYQDVEYERKLVQREPSGGPFFLRALVTIVVSVMAIVVGGVLLFAGVTSARLAYAVSLLVWSKLDGLALALVATTLSALMVGALAGWAVAFRTRLPRGGR